MLIFPWFLIKENRQLRHLLAEKSVSEIMLEDIGVNGSSLNLQFAGGAAQILAESFAEQLVESGADNYLEISFCSKLFMPGEQIVVTLQRVMGKTPHLFRVEAENELNKLKEKFGA